MVLAKVRMNDLPNVVAMAVWGDPDDENSNPFRAPTRRPCPERCDPMFVTIPEVSERMLILSSNEDFSVCELYTAKELHDYYEKDDLTIPLSEVPPYDLSDSMDDAYYGEQIEIPYLLPKVWKLFPESPHVQRFQLDEIAIPWLP